MVRKMKTFSLITLLTLFFSAQASAGFLIEPYLGYVIAGETTDTNYTPVVTTEYSGLNLGGRLGFQYLGLMAGAQYEMMSTDLDVTQVGTGTAKDAVKKSNMGIFVGYNFPMMLRVWGTYFLDSTLEGDDPNKAGLQYINSTDTISGGGYALGVGFTALPFISLNLEYRTYEYDEWEDTDGTPSSGNYTKKPESNEIFLSVSAPFVF
ncbi:MAG: outer membrane beta-barrel protein [Bacteriovoracaceae bacterium]|nr:outer membrane beta-barrel protein [Bacteriovoracaceae bacterium]